jgi:colanic acid biosynthesis protein WcaH
MHPDNLRASISALEAALGDPTTGLPSEVFRFVSRVTPLVTVDLLIQDEGSRTLLTWRDDQFYGAGWHVPGGVIRFKESAADRVHACARDELGVDVDCDPVPLLVLESIRAEETRGHSVSLLFRCRLCGPLDVTRQAAADPPAPGLWRWHDGCPANLLEVQRPYAHLF